jgi:hypothetical protein
MTLTDIRKLAIKKRLKIRFSLPKNSMDCVITETGVASVPELKAPPDFNLEEQTAQVQQFRLEPSGEKARPQTVNRQELEAMIAALSGAGAAAAAADHDD